MRSAPCACRATSGNEDCLYLNVWTGAKAAGEKRPVMVWIYGGGYYHAAPARSPCTMARRWRKKAR